MKLSVEQGAIVAVLLVTFGCGGGGSTKPKRDLTAYCAAIGDHMERRFAQMGKLDELVESAPRLRSDAATPNSEHVLFWQRVTTAAATLETGASLGTRCVTADPADPACVAFYRVRLALDAEGRLAELVTAQKNVRDGLRGTGKCALKSLPPALREQDPCEELKIRLSQGESKPEQLTEAELGWDAAEAILGRGPMPSNVGDVRDAIENALTHAAERRALIDYGIALLPLCIGTSAARSCDWLLEGLDQARPKELQSLLKAVGYALDGKGCTK
ncbi:MAG: hypothetical protein K8M05_38490 [Deltaproteobacteria bacterium]|nr:hypothetical protein [Kofleriaceae bacterium]